MTIVVLNYTLMITDLIRKARGCGEITRDEAEYLIVIAQHSPAAESTRALVDSRNTPDFLYAALHFSTMVWQSGEAAGDEDKARAGYMLAQFALAKESPDHDPYWAAKLLREFYRAHEVSTQDPVDCEAGNPPAESIRRTVPRLKCV